MATTTEPLISTKGELTILDGNGDSKITWNRNVADEVRLAREHFNRLREKHYLAFRMTSSGERGSQIDAFDERAEEILMVPRSVGG